MDTDPMQPSLQLLYDAFPSAAPELAQVVQAFSASGSNTPHAATLVLQQASPYLAQSPLVLVSGPTGIGKSFLIHRVAAHFDIQTTTLLPGLIDLHFPHLPERGIDYHFYAAKKRAVELGPGRFALILDNVDTFFNNAEMGFALIHNLRLLLSSSNSSSILVMATVREPDRVPNSFHSFVTDTISIALPTQLTRPSLLSLALTTVGPSHTTASRSTDRELATHPSCSPFLFADYVSLAYLLLSPAQGAASDISALPTLIRASTLHASAATASLVTPTTTFATLGGFAHVKAQLTRHLVWPLNPGPYAEAFSRLSLTPTAGILLVGPPGTGKTLLASALAGECGLPFLSMSVAQLVRGHVGESEKQVAKVFGQARGVGGGCVVFLDEVDAVFSGAGEGGEDAGGELASKMVAQLVLELDTCATAASTPGAGRVVVLAATNHPWRLSEALVRPGRLDTHVYVGLPSARDREEILRKLVDGDAGGWIAQVASKTEGFSGADLKALVVRARAILAAEAACARDGRERDMEWAVGAALGKVKPSVKREEVERVKRWMRRNSGAARR